VFQVLKGYYKAEEAAKRLKWNSILGSEFSGYIVAVGKDVDPSFKENDRIAGVIRGCHSKDGAFAEYVVANPQMCFKVPDHMHLSDACTISLGWICAGQALRKVFFHSRKRLRLTKNDRKDDMPGGTQDTVGYRC
jgi:NADPH:quinone reductase-like Zn-dependent oxidoreductase